MENVDRLVAILLRARVDVLHSDRMGGLGRVGSRARGLKRRQRQRRQHNRCQQPEHRRPRRLRLFPK
jgi:hypothetical protein